MLPVATLAPIARSRTSAETEGTGLHHGELMTTNACAGREPSDLIL